jgi:alpha-L-fucosidase
MSRSLSRRDLLRAAAASAAAAPLAGMERAGAGPSIPEFQPSWESLHNYVCPQWFRDAKFGIWAHWTAQCVPEQGDWYARQMYIRGEHDYWYHCAHYGHPSKFGFKDIDNIWHAENWDPEHLIGLYKAAGAKYFVALANHHDNFDCFDSTYQPWNSVRIGPKKDIVGTWAKAARAHGLRFGATVHAARTWNWFEPAQGADAEGPMAGIPYDGHLTKADGAGTWWEGLDPQDLYAQHHTPRSVPSPAYCEKFYNRVVELIHKYNPDLLYFDDGVLPLFPFSNAGLRIAAEYYNHSMRTHGGRLEAVLTGKDLQGDQPRCITHDFERGRSDRIEPYPWQTDTCIGEWHYRRSLYEHHSYKTVDQVVKMLVDIVSKNGCLLLNIPVRGDGTIDEDEVSFVQGLAPWTQMNGEGIYGTRPWRVAGEGPVKVKGGGFSEGGEERLTSEDFRFTTKGNTLYAFALGWPESGKLTVRSLAEGAPGAEGRIRRVQLLGHGQIPFTRTAEGLVVSLPEQRPCDHAWTLKISGLENLARQT